MTPQHEASPLRSPRYVGMDESVVLPKQRASPSSYDLPYRRSNPSLSSVFASTATTAHSSGASTPSNLVNAGTAFGTANNNGVVLPSSVGTGAAEEPRNIILRSFVPHVEVLASADTEEMMAKKGFSGGFLEILRPFGELVAGKATIRDSIGASKTFEDFGVRFTGIKDLLGLPKADRRSSEHSRAQVSGRSSSNSSRPTSGLGVSRMGGNVAQIEELVDKHLMYSEFQPPTPTAKEDIQAEGPHPSASIDTVSPFWSLYFRRLLSALPLTPHETFSHPVACVIAISSRSPDPIEELRRLYVSSNNGDDRLPQWVNNEFLRYYVLVHDDDHDDIGKSTQLYDQMKRHFGLHCHLLRLRSSQCIPSDDDAVRLPASAWLSASEELAEISRRELSEDVEDPTPCLFESDTTAIKTFIRELVTQSIIPSMERACAAWNDQVATRRRGLSGRLMSLSKRWTPFGGSTRNASSPIGGQSSSGNSNYDSLQGFYRPDAPEAVMRKLADYAFMLRDFKLAHSTYDLCRSDYENDKAWKYYAGANEMTLISMLMNAQPTAVKSRVESVDRMLEAATHSYIHRCIAPFYALRTLALAMELLKLRGPTGAEDAARWGNRALELGLVGPVGHPLVAERLSSCYANKHGIGGTDCGDRKRKVAFWSLLAAESFLGIGKSAQAEKCLERANAQYRTKKDNSDNALQFAGMQAFLNELRSAIVTARIEAIGPLPEGSQAYDDNDTQAEEETELLDPKPHRHSMVGVPLPMPNPLEGGPPSPVRLRDRGPLEAADEGFT